MVSSSQSIRKLTNFATARRFSDEKMISRRQRETQIWYQRIRNGRDLNLTSSQLQHIVGWDSGSSQSTNHLKKINHLIYKEREMVKNTRKYIWDDCKIDKKMKERIEKFDIIILSQFGVVCLFLSLFSSHFMLLYLLD